MQLTRDQAELLEIAGATSSAAHERDGAGSAPEPRVRGRLGLSPRPRRARCPAARSASVTCSTTARRFARTAIQTPAAAPRRRRTRRPPGASPRTAASGPSTARMTSATLISSRAAPAGSRRRRRAGSSPARRGAGRTGCSPGSSAGCPARSRSRRPSAAVAGRGQLDGGAHGVVGLRGDPHVTRDADRPTARARPARARPPRAAPRAATRSGAPPAARMAARVAQELLDRRHHGGGLLRGGRGAAQLEPGATVHGSKAS